MAPPSAPCLRWCFGVARLAAALAVVATFLAAQSRGYEDTAGESLEPYWVTSEKPAPFADGEADLPRSPDDSQPYYLFDDRMIEESGALTVEDFLRSRLTMNTVAQAYDQAYASALGAASDLGLRGLGSGQTLVLVDGRRIANLSYFGNAYQPDINGVPLGSIDRIEVLPSSASAIYGGSAVGGVINIVLKKDYSGGELTGSYDNPMDTSAPARAVGGSYGFSIPKLGTHVTIGGRYAETEPLASSARLGLAERGIGAVLRNAPNQLYSATQPFQGATTNIALDPAVYTPPGGILYADPTTIGLTLKNGGAVGSSITHLSAGVGLNANVAAALVAGAGAYDLAMSPGTGEYGLGNTLGTAQREKSFRIDVRKKLASSLEAFVDFSTSSNAGAASYNPFGGPFVVPGSAPGNPFQENVFVAFPSALATPYLTDNVTRSVTAGLLARFPKEWSVDVDYTWTESAFESAYFSYDPTAFAAALANGSIDPFVDTLQNQPDLASYLRPVAYAGGATLNDASLRGSGPFGNLPGGRPTLTFGFEHRKEGMGDGAADLGYPLTPANDERTLYFGHSQSIDSAYLEARLPIIGPANRLPTIRSAEFQLAGRTESYDVSTGTSLAALFPNAPAKDLYSPATPNGVTPLTGPPFRESARYASVDPTVGVKIETIDGFVFRASFGRAFLPPTYGQLLNVPEPAPIPTTVADPQTGKTYGVQTVQERNSDLKPQTSRDWDIGAIWEPMNGPLKGLRADAEFFRIDESDVIAGPPGGAQFIVSNPAAYGDRITRNPSTGLITVVDTSSLNLYKLETEGWDFSIGYRKKTDFGTLDVRGLTTIEEHFKQQVSLALPMLEYAGYVAEGGPLKTKANATLAWTGGGWTVSWTTTFYDGYKQYGAPGDPLFSQQRTAPYLGYIQAQGAYRIPSQTVHDLAIGCRWTTPGIVLRMGVKNVLNTPPPFDAYYGPYYYSPFGDPRLRNYWLSVTKSL